MSAKQTSVEQIAHANALREANEMLRAIVDSSPSAIVGLDTDRRITTWNNAATRLYGYLPEEVIGKVFPDTAQDISIFTALFQRS